MLKYALLRGTPFGTRILETNLVLCFRILGQLANSCRFALHVLLAFVVLSYVKRKRNSFATPAFPYHDGRVGVMECSAKRWASLVERPFLSRKS